MKTPFRALAIAPVAALIAALAIGPAFAEDEKVCDVPADKAQPTDVLKSKLESEGWEVRQIKQDKGCYEVYAKKADGTRMEKLFDPATLEMLDVEAD